MRVKPLCMGTAFEEYEDHLWSHLEDKFNKDDESDLLTTLKHLVSLGLMNPLAQKVLFDDDEGVGKAN